MPDTKLGYCPSCGVEIRQSDCVSNDEVNCSTCNSITPIFDLDQASNDSILN